MRYMIHQDWTISMSYEADSDKDAIERHSELADVLIKAVMDAGLDCEYIDSTTRIYNEDTDEDIY